MKDASAVGDEDKSTVNSGRAEDVLLQGIGPDEAIGSDVAGARDVKALKPGFVLAPPDVAAAGHVEAVVVEDGHAVEVAGALAAVAVEAVDVGLGRAGVEVELPHLAEEDGRLHRPVRQR